MSLLQKIKEDSVTARKAKDPMAAFLVTLYSEAAMIGKDKRRDESTDEEVIIVLKKFKTNAKTLIDAAIVMNTENVQERIDQATREIELLDNYLPTMLSEVELREKLTHFSDMLDNDVSLTMGSAMVFLKQTYPSQYDGRLASKIVKELLS